ncbi:hypothetical protein AX16_001393 [Volvariella volvacea WC 439]|nr:hypothetical protein AX16_001393 [Volvariella volvacea WC 439]
MSDETVLPTIAEIRSGTSSENSPLARALAILFESSPVLVSVLEPQISSSLASNNSISTYAELIDVALEAISTWKVAAQANFIAGHPRIGEVKNLSKLSAKEQAGQGITPTPPEVLARLKHLNECYEAKYPGLRYITFVNGRTRAVIAEEMEDKLGIPHTLSPNEPAPDTLVKVEVDGQEWRAELSRAITDIGLIAKSRLRTLGVQ